MTEEAFARAPVIEADGSVLVFGGPYSNLQATEAVLAVAAREGTPPSRVVCTGDVVAYCGDPVATIDRVREAGITVVAGNTDESLGAGSRDCGCGFEEGSVCSVLARDWYALADASVRDDQRAWLAALPARAVIAIGGRRLGVIHGSIEATAGYVFASSPAGEKARQIAASGLDGLVGGHCGLPFVERVDVPGSGEGLWLNAGVVGMPANDGTPRAWYAILTPEADGAVTVRLRSLAYDHGAAAARMRAEGMPEPYAETLATGLWPSLDILPTAERAATGIALAHREMRWPAPDGQARTEPAALSTPA